MEVWEWRGQVTGLWEEYVQRPWGVRKSLVGLGIWKTGLLLTQKQAEDTADGSREAAGGNGADPAGLRPPHCMC